MVTMLASACYFIALTKYIDKYGVVRVESNVKRHHNDNNWSIGI